MSLQAGATTVATVEIKYTRQEAWRTIAVKVEELPRFQKLMKQLGAKVKVKP